MTAESIYFAGYILVLCVFAVPVLRSQLAMPRRQAQIRVVRLMMILSVASVTYTVIGIVTLALLRR
ncbi:hypothetical protein [Rhodopirellula europaea]|uniref:hypothetical protein n=1 Tax=Rhodopirellula europaea TaxID=1263866 RepID=UPI003D28D0CF